MRFKKNNTAKSMGKKVGFIFSYFLFTTILFLILKITKKIPKDWNYLYLLLITGIILFIGIGIKKVLR